MGVPKLNAPGGWATPEWTPPFGPGPPAGWRGPPNEYVPALASTCGHQTSSNTWLQEESEFPEIPLAGVIFKDSSVESRGVQW